MALWVRVVLDREITGGISPLAVSLRNLSLRPHVDLAYKLSLEDVHVRISTYGEFSTAPDFDTGRTSIEITPKVSGDIESLEDACKVLTSYLKPKIKYEL